MWHKPCRTFHLWCLCIKTRCLGSVGITLIGAITMFDNGSFKSEIYMGVYRNAHSPQSMVDAVRIYPIKYEFGFIMFCFVSLGLHYHFSAYISSICSDLAWLLHCHCGNDIIALGVVNSLWSNDAIWRQRSRSTLAQVMACCLTVPSHYLSQC